VVSLGNLFDGATLDPENSSMVTFGRFLSSLVLALGGAFVATSGAARPLEPLFRTPTAGVTAAAASTPVALTSDGRFLLFETHGHDLGAADGNGTRDAWVFDRQTGTASLVSPAADDPARTAEHDTRPIAITPDGRFVLLQSLASDLQPGGVPGNPFLSAYVHDRQLGTTVVASPGDTPTSRRTVLSVTALSDDGRYVLFGRWDQSDGVFLHDLTGGTTTLVSHRASDHTAMANARSDAFDMTPDGRFVLFESSATDLVAGATDGNNLGDVFVWDRTSGAVEMGSHVPGVATTAGNSLSRPVSITPDGRFVLFNSIASNLVSGITDTNSSIDVFVWDRSSNTVGLVSESAVFPGITPSEGTEGLGLSDDGRFVLLRGSSPDLVAGATDVNGLEDLVLVDRSNGSRQLVSHAAGQPLVAANEMSFRGLLSADGRFVVWSSEATNLVPSVGNSNQVYRFDRTTGLVEHLSKTPDGDPALGDHRPVALSFDGRHVALVSSSTSLTLGLDANAADDAFLVDGNGPSTTLASRSVSQPTERLGRSSSTIHGLSDDGRFVLFSTSDASVYPELVDANGGPDVFRLDRHRDEIVLVSHAAGQPNQTAAASDTTGYALSSNGHFALFSSRATNVVPGTTDGNGSADLFVADLKNGLVSLVTHRAGQPLVTASGVHSGYALSADGRYVLLRSNSEELDGAGVGAGATQRVFLHDRSTGSTVLASHASSSATARPNGSALPVGLTPDGRFATFASAATDLVAGITDTNAALDTFVFDRTSGVVELLSPSATAMAATGNARSMPVAITPNGRFVLIESLATDLVAGIADSHGKVDLFVRDRQTGTTHLVAGSATSAGEVTDGGTAAGAITADGRFVLFLSASTDVLPGPPDFGFEADCFVADRTAGTVELVTHHPANLSDPDGGLARCVGLAANGRYVLLETVGLTATGNDPAFAIDVFRYDRVERRAEFLTRRADSDRGGNGNSSAVAISANGNVVTLESNAADLSPIDLNNQRDGFVFSSEIFVDGFESGTAGRWSAVVP
jgi:Tol biopolymer transport system component